MEEFDEQELQNLINEALSEKTHQHPFSNSYLGLAETNLLEILYERLSKRFINSDLDDIFQEARTDILSRKIPLTLTELHTVTKNCKKCNISAPAELPKWNVENPDIVVVVESPSLPQEAVSLMVSAFKKAGLNSNQLCLTYVNRCPVKRKYESKEIINCSTYLHSEIQILNPKLVVCLGGLASSVLFGTETKIKDVRGEIMWLGYWPILSTYSPMYVLKQNSIDESNSSVDHFQNDILQAYNFISKSGRKEYDN